MSIDGTGGSPALLTQTFPTEWAGGSARMLRYAARLTLTGAATWLPTGNSQLSTITDPDAINSTMELAFEDVANADVTGVGATMSGSPNSSLFVDLLVAASAGASFAPPNLTLFVQMTTGHPYFDVAAQPAGSTFVMAIVTLGATPPTITDPAGLTWTLVEQVQFGDAYFTMWRAPVPFETGVPGTTRVLLSEVCDSGIGIGLVGTPV